MDQMNPFTAAALSVAQNNAWSAEQAQKQMDFQERMSNTAHVREIADLKAAGLNPVLSAKLGGASTPSGAMASGDTSGTGAIVSLFDKMLENQSAEKLLQMRLDNSNEQLEKKFDFEREMTAMNNAVAVAQSEVKSGSSAGSSSSGKKIMSGSGATIKGSSPVKRKNSETQGRERVVIPAGSGLVGYDKDSFSKEAAQAGKEAKQLVNSLPIPTTAKRGINNAMAIATNKLFIEALDRVFDISAASKALNMSRRY